MPTLEIPKQTSFMAKVVMTNYMEDLVKTDFMEKMTFFMETAVMTKAHSGEMIFSGKAVSAR